MTVACYHRPAMKFTVILEPEADGGYSVVCPAIPGCVSQGDSLDEALADIREAILLCLEVRREDQAPPACRDAGDDSAGDPGVPGGSRRRGAAPDYRDPRGGTGG